MNKFARELLEAIEQFDTIVLFRHQHPDPDALGSQMGLKTWLQAAYPEKTILALGEEGEGMDSADDETIRKALAIVTDTSNAARVDDQRYKTAAKLIRIDHHVKVEDMGDPDYVDDQAAAACELAALILKELDQNIPPESAQWLLKGLMADSQRFTISSVRNETFIAGGWLVSQGADPVQARIDLFSMPYEEYVYSAKIRAQSQKKNRFLFAVMSRQDYLQAGVSYDTARSLVNALSGIQGMEVWCLFTENEEDSHYAASVRSNTISIRDLAVELGGGGHECACGIKNLSAEQVSELIEKLAARSEEA